MSEITLREVLGGEPAERGEAVEERRHLKAQQPHGILSLSAFLKFRRPLVFFPSIVIK